MEIHIIKDSKILGIFSEEQIESMIRSKMLSPSDMYWREGMDDWQPLQLGFSAFSKVPPPLRSYSENDISQHPVVLNGHIQRTRKIAVIFLSIFCCWLVISFMISLVLVFGDLYNSTKRDVMEVQFLLSALFGLIGVPGIVFAAILHYKCWNAIPPEDARTTPGKAVGFLFIPFYSFYWHFVSIAGLARDYKKWTLKHCVKMNDSILSIGLSLAVLNVVQFLFLILSFFILPLSFIPSIISVASMILYYSFFSEISKIAELAEQAKPR